MKEQGLLQQLSMYQENKSICLIEKEILIVLLINYLLFIDHDISDTILHMLDMASSMHNQDFAEDDVDGGVEGVFVNNEEDMLVAVCYIAECVTLGK